MSKENKLYFKAEKEAIFPLLSRNLVLEMKNNSTVDACNTANRDVEQPIESYNREITFVKYTTMQVNVQFLQQLQPEWSRFVTVVKQSKEIDTISYHTLFDNLKQYQNEVNGYPFLRRIAKSAIHYPLLPAAQPYSIILSSTKPQELITSSSTRPSASTRHKGKEIDKPVTP
ncbi:hypothetical protein Tco_1500470 [Tanacetum coccineum]